MSEEKKVAAEMKLSLSEEMHLGFLESMAKTNTEKITREILEGLSEDTGESDSYDADSGGEDSEDRPWRPSHSVFGKSTIGQSHLENMKGRYFRDMSIVRADAGERTVSGPEDDEVVIFRSFLKAGLRFPLSRFVVEVLKLYQVYLHQLTPEAIIRMGIFVWAVKSQGLEPSAKSFCNIHELLYETKPWGKEQYHNNFGCYNFGARSGSSCPVPTFRKRWPGEWMKEWFYVKNDLMVREDIKDIIMRPIWQRFGLRKPKTNTEKITREILEGLSEDTGESDSYDADSGGEDSEDRPWRPSHSVFRKSTIGQSHLENMKGRYFRDMSIVRADSGERTVSGPEDEVVIFRS
jgi:hypothetical protein